jgi:hypothetical protein
VIALGSILATAIGIWVGWRGNLPGVAAGLLVTTIIATVDYAALHPEGFNGPAPDLPWGAVSFIGYTFGLAAGLIASLAR